jgi:fructan beta-fructosidase
VKLFMEMIVQNQYVNLPVKNGAPTRRTRLLVNGEVVRDFGIELAEGEPDFWVFADVSTFQGERLTIAVDDLAPGSRALESITQSDTIEGAENLYQEKYRPQFHFTSRRGWNNDPNGLVYYKGEYHLFYQHNPYGWVWGNMHWGHAVSRDLIHWQELPVALYPDELGAMFSGSGVVDWRNTARCQTGEDKALVCIYTSAGMPFTQCIAYSNDRGRTWTKYAGNPVLEHIVGTNRDPKVVWHTPTEKWVMALYLDGNDYALFSSPDLKEWTQLCDIELPGDMECPDLLELPVDGDSSNTKWIFWGANGHYLIGAFDGNAFTPETFRLRAYCGGSRERGSAYAAQTWSDIPSEDGRRIQIAWLQGDMPSMPFNQQMTFPVELILSATEEGMRLHFSPVREIEQLYEEKRTLCDVDLSEDPTHLRTDGCDLLDIHADVEIKQASEIELNLRGMPVVYDVERQKLLCCDRTAPLKAPGGRLRLRILLDRASIEIFAAGGLVYMPLAVIPEDNDRSCFLLSRGGRGKAVNVDVFKLYSIWGSRG